MISIWLQSVNSCLLISVEAKQLVDSALEVREQGGDVVAKEPDKACEETAPEGQAGHFVRHPHHSSALWSEITGPARFNSWDF